MVVFLKEKLKKKVNRLRMYLEKGTMHNMLMEEISTWKAKKNLKMSSSIQTNNKKRGNIQKMILILMETKRVIPKESLMRESTLRAR